MPEGKFRFRDFFHGKSDKQTTDEELERAGYDVDVDEEVPEDVLELHRHLEESSKPKKVEVQAPEDQKKEDLSPEQEKNRETMRLVAKNLVDCFDFNPGKESFLVITDGTVMEKNPDLIQALEDILREMTEQDAKTKGNFEIIVVPSAKKSATPFGDAIGEKLKDRPVLIVTCKSRSHSREVGSAIKKKLAPKENFEAILKSPKLKGLTKTGGTGFDESFLDNVAENGLSDVFYEHMQEKAFARNKGIRLISITKGHNPFEILTKGAVEESVDNLRERGDKIGEMMKDVVEVKITSAGGSNLTVRPRVDKTEIEDGRIDKPGKLSNYPIGEWSCSIALKNSRGTLVVDGPIGGGHNLDQVIANGPIKMDIEDGTVIKINDTPVQELLAAVEKGNLGNPLLDSLVKYLKSGGDPKQVFRLAELGIGTNGKACKDKTPENIGSSEGEKELGTAHIAVGSNGTFGLKENDPDYNNCEIHCDNIVGTRDPITVECVREDGTTFFLIKDGQPQNF